MFNLFQDGRFALRTLVKQPAFTAIVMVTVALGVGANTAMFSIVHGVLIEPLAYERPSELVWIFQADRFNNTTQEAASGPDYFDYVERQTQFSALGAYSRRSPTLTDGVSDPERVAMARATHTLFRTLGVEAMLGRLPLADEDVPGAPQVAALSYGYWQRRFGGDSSIVGKGVALDAEVFTVIGVLPPGFAFPPGSRLPIDVWAPLQFGPTSSSRGVHNLVTIGRLNPGATLETAQAEMSRIMASLETEYPDDNVGRGANVVPLEEPVTGGVRPILMLLMGCVGLVLLIACFNVANLLLSRGAARQREVAVRAALGAGRVRIVRQLLVESLLLAAAGGALGVVLAFGAVRLIRGLNPANLPRLSEIALSPTVLGFAFAIAVATGLLFGILPALSVSQTNLNQALADGGRTSASGRTGRLRAGLAVLQVAIAFVLVMGAGLVTRSIWNLTRVDPGFRAEGLAQLTLNLPAARYPVSFRPYPIEAPRVLRFHADLVERARRLPFASGAALALNHPMNPGWTTRVTIEGGPQTVQEGVEEERIRPISPGYFSVSGIPLLLGRDFDDRDVADAAPVVIVNEAFARKYFPDEHPIGRRFAFWGVTREIVGVVADVKFMGVQRSGAPAMYPPLSQLPFTQFDVIVRGAPGDEARIINAVRAEIRQLDPELAVLSAQSLDAILSQTLGPQRFNAILLGVFAALALVLATVGIYGVISYAVSRRTHEFGVRMSFGADRGAVSRLVLTQAVRLTAVGIALGLAGSLAASNLIRGMLFQVGAIDPATMGGVALFLAGVALVASLIPALRASRVDPLVALRQE